MLRLQLLVCLGFVTACGGGQKSVGPTKSAGASSPVAGARPIKMPRAFERIPASTPYLLTLDYNAPWLREYVRLFGIAAQEIYRDLKNARPSMSGPEAAIADGIFDLLGDDLTSESLARIGLPTFPKFYVYGLGVMPAVRVRLTSGKKLHVAINKVRGVLGKHFPASHTIGGRQYWYIPIPGDDNDHKLAVAIAIVGDDLVAGLIHEDLKDEMLRSLLEPVPVGKSFAASGRIRSMLRRTAVQPSQLMFFDIVQIASQLLGTVPGRPARLAAKLFPDMPRADSPACRRELNSLLSIAPRVIGGLKKMSEKSLAATFVIELHADAVSILRSSRARRPGGDIIHQGQMGVSVGLAPERFGVHIVALAQRVGAKPFACPVLQGVNDIAGHIAKLAVQPTMKRLGFPTGFAAVINRWDRDNDDIAGAVTITGGNADAMWLAAQNFLPFLRSLKLEPDGAPMPIPVANGNTPMFAARDKSLIGGAFGVGSEHTLSQLMATPMGTDDLFMLFSYDGAMNDVRDHARLLTLFRTLKLADAEKRFIKRIGRSAKSRGTVTLRVTDAGLVVDWALRRDAPSSDAGVSLPRK